MNQRFWILVVCVLTPIAWWMLRADPEGEVREAHERLAALIGKSEDETRAGAILNARALQGMFASDVEVSGNADAFVGTYTAESIGSAIVQMRELFEHLDLSFQDLAVSLPEDDVALTSFTAVLVGSGKHEEIANLIESRTVVTRMRRVDGEWLFAAFDLSGPRGIQ